MACETGRLGQGTAKVPSCETTAGAGFRQISCGGEEEATAARFSYHVRNVKDARESTKGAVDLCAGGRLQSLVEMSEPRADPPAEDPPEGGTAPSAVRRSRVDLAREQEALGHIDRGDDDAAVAILVETYGNLITTYAFRRLRDVDRAKDVSQSVFIQAHKKFSTFKRRGTLLSWLYAITRRRCLDEQKRTRRTVVEDMDVLEERAGPSEALVDDERVALQHALERCLGQLSEELLDQVLMRYFFGFSYEEMSEAVGDAPGTIQVRLSRLMPMLRRCLRNQGVWR